MIEVDPGRFEDMVVTALDGLPEEPGQLMRNVAVTAGHRPGPSGLPGLYEGIPLTSRTSQYAGVLPDRITIYRQAICAICRTEQEAGDQVRRTVIHEIAHHFGIEATGSANSAGKTWIRSARMRASAAYRAATADGAAAHVGEQIAAAGVEPRPGSRVRARYRSPGGPAHSHRGPGCRFRITGRAVAPSTPRSCGRPGQGI